MDAKQYLEKYGREKTRAVFEAAGTKWSYGKHVINGFKRPGVDLAHRLEKASNGKMKAMHLLKPKSQAATEPAAE